MEESKIKYREAIDKTINTELFNNVVAFIFGSSGEEKKNDVLNTLNSKFLYFDSNEAHSIQEKYGFKYFGEILERYEEKIENNIANTRAIALALGFCNEIVSKEMIIGNQKENFIHKIESLAEDDIYLTSALYLYDKVKYKDEFENLVNKEFHNTEDIVFVLSVYDDFKRGYELYKNQLLSLIGKNKTISVINNIYIYEWLIHNLDMCIKKQRNKDIELLKALITIPTIFMNEDNKYYKVLIENGYSKEEIAYLNYAILELKPVNKTVRMGKSINEEKIAVRFCKTILNSEKNFSKGLYNYIKNLFWKYKNFDIICYGKRNIKDILKDEVYIVNPITFIEMYEEFYNYLLGFDIFDSKWDIVAKEFKTEDYEELIDNYILSKKLDKENIKKLLEKYLHLKGNDYIKTFYEFKYKKENIFKYLVETGIFNLNTICQDYENCKIDRVNLEYLKKYVEKIRNRASFLFLKEFLKKHSIEETDNYGFSLRNLVYIRRPYYYLDEDSINIERQFLSNNEQLEFFEIINNYMYKVSTQNYLNFIGIVLASKTMENLLPHEELRKIFFKMTETDEHIKDSDFLKCKYLTEQELEEYRLKKQREKEEKELQEKKEKENEIRAEFDNIKDDVIKIEKFYKDYEWDREEKKISLEIIKSYFEKGLSKIVTNVQEILSFNNLCGKLLINQIISINDYKRYLENFVVKGID